MENYLTLQNLKSMIRAISPIEQSKIISGFLNNKVIINNGNCYIINENNVYDIKTKYENIILSIVSKLIFDSYNNLSGDYKKDLEELRDYKQIFNNVNIHKYLPQLLNELESDKILFDVYFSEIHFKNGYIDLQTNKFEERKIGKHYITTCISYDYKPSTVENRNKIFKELSKIYPKEKILNVILTIIGSALTGLSTRDSYLLFLIGEASAGKSTILDLTKITVQCYVKQIKPDTFVEGKNTDKIVNTYHKCPYIRLTWLNEPKDRKNDCTFIKSWADGECNAEKLYQEGSHDFKHYSLTFFTANNMPNIQIDGGIQRRIRAYEHKSQFVDNIKDVDEKNNIYLKNSDLKIEFDNSLDLKLAFFDILANFANKWLKNKKIDLPIEFKETTNDILESNDHIKDFADGYLTVTEMNNDRISKTEMLNLFNKVYPNKHLQILQLITLLKGKKIKYDRKLRCKGIQGCFYCVKFREDDDDDDTDELTKDQQIESLENQIYGLQQQLIKIKSAEIKTGGNTYIDNITINIFDKSQQPINKKHIDDQLEELNYFNSVIKTITKNHTENIDLLPKQETQKNELLTEQQIRTIKKRQIYDKDKVNGDQVLDYIQNKKLEDTLKLNLDEIFKKHF